MNSPEPPKPAFVRKPQHAFGWLDARLLSDGWLRESGPHGGALLVLLAIAADRRGASFYSRDRMASALAMTREQVDAALTRLLELQLVAFKPWRPRCNDGVWQLLPLPLRQNQARGATMRLGTILASLGLDSAPT